VNYVSEYVSGRVLSAGENAHRLRGYSTLLTIEATYAIEGTLYYLKSKDLTSHWEVKSPQSKFFNTDHRAPTERCDDKHGSQHACLLRLCRFVNVSRTNTHLVPEVSQSTIWRLILCRNSPFSSRVLSAVRNPFPMVSYRIVR
jgi:hypothetical protein